MAKAKNMERCLLCGEMFDTYAEKELYFAAGGLAHGKCVDMILTPVWIDPAYRAWPFLVRFFVSGWKALKKRAQG